jgi:hypothetical protein
MWNTPTKNRLSNIPKLYETENTPLKDKIIYLHFYIGSCDWYISEYDGEDLFWGFAILNNDFHNAEWGYVLFNELKSINIKSVIEVDCETEEVWQPKKASEIDKIRIAHGWLKKHETQQDIPREQELILKVKAGHFQYFQDLFNEVTSPYSEFFGIDPYPIWKEGTAEPDPSYLYCENVKK